MPPPSKSASKGSPTSAEELLCEANLALARAIEIQAETIKLLAGARGGRQFADWFPVRQFHDVTVSVDQGELRFTGDQNRGGDEDKFLHQTKELFAKLTFELADKVQTTRNPASQELLTKLQAFIQSHAVLTDTKIAFKATCCTGL